MNLLKSSTKCALTLVMLAQVVACDPEQSGVVASADAVGSTSSGFGGVENAAVGVGGVGGMNSAGGAGGDASGSGGADFQPVDNAWCEAGFQGFDDGSCFYLPSGQAPTKVLVYLHGMMPPDGSAKSQQQLVAAAADSSGALAFFPMGQAGLCDWGSSVEDWLCWPSSRDKVDEHAAAIIAQWTEAAATLAGSYGLQIKQRYVLGFSNGGYFASYIGLEGLWLNAGLDVAGVGVVAAGRSFVDESLFGAQTPPVYIGIGGLDTQGVQNSAQNLAYVLSINSWPHDYAFYAQRGHEIWQTDFDTAFVLWDN